MYLKLKKYFKIWTVFFTSIIFVLNSGPRMIFSLENLDLSAKSAVLMEESTGQILYEKELDEKRSIASITKIMTLLLIMEALRDNKIKLTDTVTASEHAKSMGGSQIWLKSGETMKVEDLIKAVVIVSANDAAVALAEHICGKESNFVKNMNKKAKELNLNNTHFKNCTGLHEKGHFSSAKDVATMARELIKYKEILKHTTTWMDYLRDGKSLLVNTNKLIKSYKGITGLKTGTTEDAGCCVCATARRNDTGLIAVVLGCEKSDDRFKDAEKLLDYGFNNFFFVTPKLDNINLSPVKVLKGIKQSIKVEVLKDKKILIPKGSEKEITSTVEVKDAVCAPLAKGQVLGKVIYKIKDQQVASLDILSSEDCPKATFRNIFKNFVRSFVGG